MATEDFSTYTEVDGGGNITVTSSKIDCAAVDADEESYVYDDKDAAHFSGDYEHLIETYITSIISNGRIYLWGLANLINDFYGIDDDSSGDYHGLACYGSAEYYFLEECDGGSITQDWSGAGYDGVLCYMKIKRDEAVGANGTLYCYIYDDAPRTNLLDTLSVALGEKQDFRYIYGMSGYNRGASGVGATCYCQNLDIQEGAPPSVKPMWYYQRNKMRRSC